MKEIRRSRTARVVFGFLIGASVGVTWVATRVTQHLPVDLMLKAAGNPGHSESLRPATLDGLVKGSEAIVIGEVTGAQVQALPTMTTEDTMDGYNVQPYLAPPVLIGLYELDIQTVYWDDGNLPIEGNLVFSSFPNPVDFVTPTALPTAWAALFEIESSSAYGPSVGEVGLFFLEWDPDLGRYYLINPLYYRIDLSGENASWHTNPRMPVSYAGARLPIQSFIEDLEDSIARVK